MIAVSAWHTAMGADAKIDNAAIGIKLVSNLTTGRTVTDHEDGHTGVSNEIAKESATTAATSL
ncbi:hypothetical protein [Rhizobium sp. LjRoot258]|uniref:hypothetical protein n=1 Tax=Rhizobium sp. LjRoot258 TaxID=3342299 RepID=UPI003ED16C03